MNDRLSPAPDDAVSPLLAGQPDLALPAGLRLGGFEIQRVLARSASSIVYLATDHALGLPVALQEYVPARLVRRDAGLNLRPIEAWHDDVVARGLRAFVDEARMLARCEHPSLIRVKQLFEALGSAYRVMPVVSGQRLSDLRHEMVGAPDETALRALLDALLGTIEQIHRAGRVHGGVSPGNILLLADDQPLLLGPGAAAHEIGSDLVDSLMATLEAASGNAKAIDAEAGTPPVGAARDLYMLAETIRFCITAETPSQPGTLRAREPLADAIAHEFTPEVRPTYGPALLGTLDAALSPFPEDRPLTAAQFRDWLERGVPGGPVRVPPKPAVKPAAAAPIAATASSDTIGALPDEDTIAPWPAAGLAGATPDERTPWMPPELPPELHRSVSTPVRRNKVLASAGFVIVAAAAVAALAFWHSTPEIQLEPAIERSSNAATGLSMAPTTTAPVAITTPAAEPPPTTVAQQTPTPNTDPALTPAAPPPTADPAATLTVHPPSAGIAPRPAKPAPETPRAKAAAEPVANATNSARGPRAACAGRTEFALYRCMLQQCQAKRWTADAQCVKLRQTDRVD